MANTATAPYGSGMALSGMKEICGYVGRSEKTIRKYIAAEGFPAIKLGGEWESDKALVDSWRLSRVACHGSGSCLEK